MAITCPTTSTPPPADSGLDDLLGITPPERTPEPPLREPSRTGPVKPGQERGPLYWDLETVPDYSRLHLFGLPEITALEVKDPATLPSEALAKDIPKFEAMFETSTPTDEWLAKAEAMESQSKKPRSGILNAIEKLRKRITTHAAELEARRKLLSVTPEYCRIAAAAWIHGDGDPVCMTVDQNERTVHGLEAAVIGHLWEQIAHARRQGQPIVGFNIVGFDLPTLFFRSAIHRIKPPCKLDLRPWGTDVEDLMAKRWPKSSAMKMKGWAKLMGIEIPAGDEDGAGFEALLKADPARAAGYCRSDVIVTRAIHEWLDGYWW